MEIHLTETSLACSWRHGQHLENLHKITQLSRQCFALLVHWEVKYNIRSLRASEGKLFAQAFHLSFAKESPFEWIFRPCGFYEDGGSWHQTIVAGKRDEILSWRVWKNWFRSVKNLASSDALFSIRRPLKVLLSKQLRNFNRVFPFPSFNATYASNCSFVAFTCMWASNTLASSPCIYSDSCFKLRSASFSMHASATTNQDRSFLASPEYLLFSLPLRSDSGEESLLKCSYKAGKSLSKAVTDMNEEKTHLTSNTFCTFINSTERLPAIISISRWFFGDSIVNIYYLLFFMVGFPNKLVIVCCLFIVLLLVATIQTDLSAHTLIRVRSVYPLESPLSRHIYEQPLQQDSEL